VRDLAVAPRLPRPQQLPALGLPHACAPDLGRLRGAQSGAGRGCQHKVRQGCRRCRRPGRERAGAPALPLPSGTSQCSAASTAAAAPGARGRAWGGAAHRHLLGFCVVEGILHLRRQGQAGGEGEGELIRCSWSWRLSAWRRRGAARARHSAHHRQGLRAAGRAGPGRPRHRHRPLALTVYPFGVMRETRPSHAPGSVLLPLETSQNSPTCTGGRAERGRPARRDPQRPFAAAGRFCHARAPRPAPGAYQQVVVLIAKVHGQIDGRHVLGVHLLDLAVVVFHFHHARRPGPRQYARRPVGAAVVGPAAAIGALGIGEPGGEGRIRARARVVGPAMMMVAPHSPLLVLAGRPPHAHLMAPARPEG
jgi:hypothetical protein